LFNEVRNTVLALLNKNNNGYLTPEEFNLLAKQAQLEVFEDYFFNYNMWLTKRNARMSNSQSADITRGYIEVIDGFREAYYDLTKGPVFYELPTNWYTIDEVFVYKIPLSSSNGPEDLRTADRVSPSQVSRLLSSNLTQPTLDYPIYYMAEDTNNPQPGNTTESGVRVYPRTYPSGDNVDVAINYIRYPLDPNWTYSSIGPGGDPIFNAAATDYQDFELPLSDFALLVVKILQHAGLVIREAEVMQFAGQEEAVEQQNDN
jgi:hypothetical protein